MSCSSRFSKCSLLHVVLSSLLWESAPQHRSLKKHPQPRVQTKFDGFIFEVVDVGVHVFVPTCAVLYQLVALSGMACVVCITQLVVVNHTLELFGRCV